MKSTFAESVRPWCDIQNSLVEQEEWNMTSKLVMRVAPAVATIVFATFAAPTQAKKWEETDCGRIGFVWVRLGLF